MRHDYAVFGIVMLVLVISSSLRADVHYREWQQYQAIAGVGQVTKQSPQINNLHYGGTGSPETAVFEIDVASAKDLDRREKCDDANEAGWIWDDPQDAGLHEADTHWQNSGNGQMTDGAFTSTYTPADEIESTISISCTVWEGHQYSWEDQEDEAAETKTWSEKLNTFMVGVRVSGANDFDLWEDGSETSKTFSETAHVDAKVETTRLETGKFENTSLIPDKEYTWKAIAKSSNGSIDTITKNIKFTGSIKGHGTYAVEAENEGAHIPGFVTRVIATVVGAGGPYVKAAVTLVGDLSNWDSGSSARVTVTAVLENNNPGVQTVDDGIDDAHVYDYKLVSLGAIDMSNNYTLKPGSERKASFHGSGMAALSDWWYSLKGSARVVGVPAHPTITFTATQPTYGD